MALTDTPSPCPNVMLTPATRPHDEADMPVVGEVLARTEYAAGGYTEVRAVTVTGFRNYRVIDWGCFSEGGPERLGVVADMHYLTGAAAGRFYRGVVSELALDGVPGVVTVPEHRQLRD